MNLRGLARAGKRARKNLTFKGHPVPQMSAAQARFSFASPFFDFDCSKIEGRVDMMKLRSDIFITIFPVGKFQSHRSLPDPEQQAQDQSVPGQTFPQTPEDQSVPHRTSMKIHQIECEIECRNRCQVEGQNICQNSLSGARYALKCHGGDYSK